jgi:hypothetical protein
MEMSDRESFKEYAQRWHGVAAQGNPLLLESRWPVSLLTLLRNPTLSSLLEIQLALYRLNDYGEKI